MSVAVPPLAGDAFYVIDTVIAYRARAAETGDAYMAFEAWVPPNGSPRPLHMHAPSELFLTLEGDVQYLRADADGLAIVEGGPGTTAFVPPGVAHTYRNVSDAPARYLAVLSPGAAMEGFFDAVRRDLGAGGEPLGPLDPELLARARAAAGITWLEPPDA